ncbi:uncharacterized protein Eint_080420 [Encephalitozoon intestinalis ATCC 50506]|uniref:Ubiquitin-like domain-containing protein n=1 Tax=Encephalitozoon intestinalis (strain ATCC 50506) TaxID=876142 RepID=E0S8I4_ENCIT|nr:uncharacterized protein Eint_080420 [Encephalitozoon intestinalis ATCC 50506]ADM11978.2 hypothetical protein Eint_080420 [Encephalitozoon intestinalis ATCC 50506]UTX45764.1 hypothetical protein GPK93_08g13380 [Encephalitozoon intestinalis]
MGDDSSSEIVLAERVDHDSDEVSIVEIVREGRKLPNERRKGSGRAESSRKGRKRAVEENPNDEDDRKRLKDDSYRGKGLCRVTVVDQGLERIFHLKSTDTLEDIYKVYHREDSPIKMKYKSVPISRHLTLEEIGFDESHWIMIHRQGQTSREAGIRLKINVDYAKVVELSVSKELSVEGIFERLGEMGFEGDLLVRNGVVLNPKASTADVTRPGDIIDLVSKDEIVYRG